MTISVIIPVYNVSAYIERCIRSVMRQTFCDFECIIVDDASEDDSVAKCERMIGEYKGNICFKIIQHKYNRGLSAARNTGTDAATGDYILYIDSDDEITNDCLEKLMTPILRDKTIEMVVGEIEKFFDKYPIPTAHTENCEGENLCGLETVRHWFFERPRWSAWNKLIRKDFLIRFNLSFKEGVLWEDMLWMFYVVKYLAHLYDIKEVTYLNYIRPRSICSGTLKKKKLHHYGLVYNEISNNFTPGDGNREARFYVKGFCRCYINCGHNKLYQETAQNFKRELSINHDTALYLRLVMVGILSKTWMGRKAYHGMRKAWRKITVKG